MNRETRARTIVDGWLAHLGYTKDEIAEANTELDHSNCEITEHGWDCTDGDGDYRHHAVHVEADASAELVMFVLERAGTDLELHHSWVRDWEKTADSWRQAATRANADRDALTVMFNDEVRRRNALQAELERQRPVVLAACSWRAILSANRELSVFGTVMGQPSRDLIAAVDTLESGPGPNE